MNYVDGFLIPVARSKKEAYRELAARTAPIFKEHGALRVVECWIDEGEVVPKEFFHAADARPESIAHSKTLPQDSEPQREQELMRPWYSPGWNGQTEQRATKE